MSLPHLPAVDTARLRARAAAMIREPFLHFVVLGLLIFAFNAWRGAVGDPADRHIVVTQAEVQRLVGQWMQTWQRPPTATEVDELIRDHVKEEVYYREALHMGLDRNDEVVRRRMRAKMEFLAVSQLEQQQPTDATLQAWLDGHAAQYAPGATFSLDQIYVAARPGDGRAGARAADILRRLQQGADWRHLGDRLDAPASLEGADSASLKATFGPEFASALARMPVGHWSGPTRSGLGLHLVRIRKATPGRAPRLSEVRQAVENDWRAATLARREAEGYQALLNAYDVRIEKPR
jgi:parvulin-like peptidyl-prolyl isomerase